MFVRMTRMIVILFKCAPFVLMKRCICLTQLLRMYEGRCFSVGMLDAQTKSNLLFVIQSLAQSLSSLWTERS